MHQVRTSCAPVKRGSPAGADRASIRVNGQGRRRSHFQFGNLRLVPGKQKAPPRGVGRAFAPGAGRLDRQRFRNRRSALGFKWARRRLRAASTGLRVQPRYFGQATNRAVAHREAGCLFEGSQDGLGHFPAALRHFKISTVIYPHPRVIRK